MSRPPERPAGGRHDAPPFVHVVAIWKYVLVYLALLALVATTLGLAYVDLGAGNNIVAMAIAGCKALLVMLVFMHVRWSPKLIPLAAFGAFFWLVHLVAGSLADYLSRGLLGVPGK